MQTGTDASTTACGFLDLDPGIPGKFTRGIFLDHFRLKSKDSSLPLTINEVSDGNGRHGLIECPVGGTGGRGVRAAGFTNAQLPMIIDHAASSLSRQGAVRPVNLEP
jgi:hypothetical protein